MLSELNKLFKLILQKKKMLYLLIITRSFFFFTVIKLGFLWLLIECRSSCFPQGVNLNTIYYVVGRSGKKIITMAT